MISRNQVAGMNLHYRHYPLSYFLDSMVELGLENIELWGASPHLYVNEASYAQVEQVKHEIARRGLRTVCFTPEQCVYPVNIAAKEGELRQSSIDYFLRSLEIAEQLEVSLVLVTSGLGYFSETVSEAWKRSLESLAIIAERAKQRDITLVLEPLREEESNLVNDLKSLELMIKEVGSSHLKAMVDTIPMAIAGESLEDYFAVFGKDLVHMHFIDGKPRGHLAWGDGVLPLQHYIEVLETNDYAGYLTLEITDSIYFLDPVEADRQSLTNLEAYL